MPLVYQTSPENGSLEQGELLEDIWEHRAALPFMEFTGNEVVSFDSIHHALMMVMTAVCDLEQDYNVRNRGEVDERDPGIVPHVLLCEVFSSEGGALWGRPGLESRQDRRRVFQNQNERYYYLPPSKTTDEHEIPGIVLDFKKSLALPTHLIYAGLQPNGIRRLGVLPPIYVHDVIQRYYSYLSRVGTPDDNPPG